MKKALITGITGQDGSYLAELLLAKGYEVHGICRPSSSPHTGRIDHLMQNDPSRRAPHSTTVPQITLHFGDLTDGTSLMRIMADLRPDEVYNLGAQSHVATSFDTPELTADINALGTLRLLESIRCLGLTDKTRFYQASTSELFGMSTEAEQSETTPFRPRSPYAVAKAYAHWITVNYRENYGIFACNGILFNHESPRRGEDFVTRKITRGLARLAQGLEPCLHMGNLDALRDWGHACDYVRMQWLMLQQEEPEDYVIATGQQHSVRNFIIWAAADLGIALRFQGEGTSEIAIVTAISGDDAPALSPGTVILRIDPRLIRPAEVPALRGNPAKAMEKLGWRATVSAREICTEMMAEDLLHARAEARSQQTPDAAPWARQTARAYAEDIRRRA